MTATVRALTLLMHFCSPFSHRNASSWLHDRQHSGRKKEENNTPRLAKRKNLPAPVGSFAPCVVIIDQLCVCVYVRICLARGSAKVFGGADSGYAYGVYRTNAIELNLRCPLCVMLCCNYCRWSTRLNSIFGIIMKFC